MTGIEVVAIAAVPACSALVYNAVWNGSNKEESMALEVYRKMFKSDHLLNAAEDFTPIADDLPSGIDPRAADCIRSIERYQKGVKKSIFGSWGTIQTKILEEMKQWLCSVSDTSIQARDVTLRLEYFRQVLLRFTTNRTLLTSVGGGSRTFLQTIGEVCRLLENLLQHAVSNERNMATKLELVLGMGRELLDKSLPLVIYALPSDGAVRGLLNANPQQGRAIPEPMTTESILSAVAQAKVDSAAGKTGGAGWGTDVGVMLLALLSEAHFRALGLSDDEALESNGVRNHSNQEGILSIVKDTRSRWVEDIIDAKSSGLHPAFCSSEHRETREFYTHLIEQVDRVAFFLFAVRPYHRLSSAAGDLAMCHLHAGLGHLLHELEKALVQLRQARLETMRAAKRRLEDLASHYSSGVTNTELRWMQGLRYIQETEMDKLHRGLISQCMEVRASASIARASELESVARRGIGDVSKLFNSADFRARSKLAIPDKVQQDFKAIASGSTGGGGPAALEDITEG
jgi:hypothetical protein